MTEVDGAPIVLEGVSHAFGRGDLCQEVLHQVSAEIEGGEMVILTGPSGSGKTTLLTLVGALRSTQAGSLQVLGRELRGASERELVRVRRNIGYIFQAHNLLEPLTALQNVLLAADLHPQLRGRRGRQRSCELLEAVGLGAHIRHYPRQLSGGQRQRVAVARALAGRPRIVLADEPTASLDSAAGRAVIELLYGLARQEGATVLLVTHDIRILDIADRTLHLEDGRLTSATAAVMSGAGNLLRSLAQTQRRGELVRRVGALAPQEFAELLNQFTGETRRFVDEVRLSQSDAYESMLEQVLEAFTRKVGEVLQAERTTLFLVDEQRGEVWSKFARGAGQEPIEIRLPLGKGIAGAVAASGTPHNAGDVSQDPLFDPATDQATGLHTRSILCMPVRDDDGRVFAVVEALNKCGGQPFDAADEWVLGDFADTIAEVLGSWWQMSSDRPVR